jgi:hypothetical protein
MARYELAYSGERRTAHLGVQLTPSERQGLAEAAEGAGARLSDYVRSLCLQRSAAAGLVAGTRRNPEAKALMFELTAIGNNLNQLARHANTSGRMPEAAALHEVLELVKAAMGRVLAL